MRQEQDAAGQDHEKRYAPVDAGQGHQGSDGGCGNGHQVLKLQQSHTLPLLVHRFNGALKAVVVPGMLKPLQAGRDRLAVERVLQPLHTAHA